MALATASKKIGSHAYFFLNGNAFTVPAPGTAGRASKPGPTDAGWVDMGIIEDWNDSPVESQKDEIFAPTPGVTRLYDIVESKLKSKGSFKCKEVSPLAIQVLYRTGALTAASTQFNRLEGVLVKGWLKTQAYDQADAQFKVEDLFVALEISGDVSFGGGGLCEVTFEYTVLHSALNTGTL